VFLTPEEMAAGPLIIANGGNYLALSLLHILKVTMRKSRIRNAWERWELDWQDVVGTIALIILIAVFWLSFLKLQGN
jgi:hypothetical protein